ncbi:MAG TPA: hypothetical protein VKB88_20055 [Bryobacteraceae bacterium]|nr:hypothetical protein [Bryobacteraceae bacterium]
MAKVTESSRLLPPEVDEFHRFQKLCAEIVEVGEKICAFRPIEDTLTPKKKEDEATRSQCAGHFWKADVGQF